MFIIWRIGFLQILMARIDRYIYLQLLGVFGFTALLLVAIYWVNRAVGLLDSLVGDGQSVGVFLQMSLLTIPSIIDLITPMAAFAAALFVANKLSNESELVVLQATGFSYLRLTRPTIYFGLTVALLTAIVSNLLIPAAAAQRRELTAEISRNTTAKYLKEGRFLQPADGIVLYIRAISDAGELEDIFISDMRDTAQHQIYTAQRAFVVDDAGEPKLLMLDGVLQRKSTQDDILSTSRFADLTYSLASLIDTDSGRSRGMQELSTYEMLRGYPNGENVEKFSKSALQYRGHLRISWPISAGMTAMIGYSTLLLGGFSRQGLWGQILLAVGLLVVMYMVHIQTLSMGPKISGAWLLAYATPLVGLGLVSALLWACARPRRAAREGYSLWHWAAGRATP